jgi:hypothetical protein
VAIDLTPNALAQLWFGPDGDQDVADKLHGEVKVILFHQIQEQKEDVANKLRAAGVLDESEIEAAVAKRFPDPAKDATETSSSSDPKWWALSDKSVELRGVWETAKADPNAKAEDVSKARSAWIEATRATTAARTTCESAQSATTLSEGVTQQ